MKFHGKLAAWLLALSLIPASAVNAQATQEEAYALSCGDPKPYAYVTPFAVGQTVFHRDGTQWGSGSCAPRIYHLTGEDGHSVFAYSANAAAEGLGSYRRINLEDSPLFSRTAAGKLRAISANSFPRKQVGEIQESANQWLREMGLSQIRELQSGEAILAAQIAIWKTAGGNSYQVNSLYSGRMDLGEMENTALYGEETAQQETDNTGDNVSLLYAYFSNLDPIQPSDVLLSDASITRTVYTCVQEENGYCADISVTVSGPVGEGLLLRAQCEGKTREKPITGEGEYSVSFSGLAERSEVEISIQGVQHGADVYLFEAKGEENRILLGYDDSVLPVCCERILIPVPASP